MAVENGSLSPEKLYRLPWNLADNAITWLEPTTRCNLYCDGCYRANDPDGHRPLEDVIEDLEQLKKIRRSDGISIAGGEPLIYPHIMDLVRYVSSQGWKPIIITNGQALSREMIAELLEAGLVGFTVHVDSHQHRKDWDGKSEVELNELRLRYASMIQEAGKGKIACSFNATVYPDTLKYIPELTRWAHDHIDKVQTMVYILFRLAKVDPRFDFFVKGRKLDQESIDAMRYFVDRDGTHRDVMAPEVVEQVRQACPQYEPCAYLNSNMEGDTVKWLLSLRVGTRDKTLGYMDPKFMEINQVVHHLLYGTYLAYGRPWLMKGVQLMFPLALINRGMRKVLRRWISKPLDWFKPLYIQSMLILQPPDVLSDGRYAMCDGCPDAIYYKGRMLWKCRLEEIERFGEFVQNVPKE